MSSLIIIISSKVFFLFCFKESIIFLFCLEFCKFQRKIFYLRFDVTFEFCMHMPPHSLSIFNYFIYYVLILFIFLINHLYATFPFILFMIVPTLVLFIYDSCLTIFLCLIHHKRYWIDEAIIDIHFLITAISVTH